MKCEKCDIIHDGNYGSGRFCSSKCARSFSTKNKREEINEKVSKKLANNLNSKGKPKYRFTDYDRTKGKIQQKINNERLILIKPFNELSKTSKKKIIEKEQNYKCKECQIEKVWNNKPLVFHLDHIDGNNRNNIKSNLRCICPNCHSQTETYAGRNKKVIINDSELISLFKDSKSINQILDKAQLAKVGSNYSRVKNLMMKVNFQFKE